MINRHVALLVGLAFLAGCSTTDPKAKTEVKQDCRLMPRQGTLAVTRVCVDATPEPEESAPNP